MNTELEKKLKKFVGNNNDPEVVEEEPKYIIDNREGLIERVDKIFVTKDGKQLLREQY